MYIKFQTHPSYSASAKFLPWRNIYMARNLIILLINQLCFLTFTDGDLVTPCPILQTLNLECVHFHIILEKNMKRAWRGEGVALVIVSLSNQI